MATVNWQVVFLLDRFMVAIVNWITSNRYKVSILGRIMVPIVDWPMIAIVSRLTVLTVDRSKIPIVCGLLAKSMVLIPHRYMIPILNRCTVQIRDVCTVHIRDRFTVVKTGFMVSSEVLPEAIGTWPSLWWADMVRRQAYDGAVRPIRVLPSGVSTKVSPPTIGTGVARHWKDTAWASIVVES